MIDTDKMVKHVETLVAKAADSGDSNEAMRFSQAACNAANALSAVRSNERADK